MCNFRLRQRQSCYLPFWVLRLVQFLWKQPWIKVLILCHHRSTCFALQSPPVRVFNSFSSSFRRRDWTIGQFVDRYKGSTYFFNLLSWHHLSTCDCVPGWEEPPFASSKPDACVRKSTYSHKITVCASPRVEHSPRLCSSDTVSTELNAVSFNKGAFWRFSCCTVSVTGEFLLGRWVRWPTLASGWNNDFSVSVLFHVFVSGRLRFLIWV